MYLLEVLCDFLASIKDIICLGSTGSFGLGNTCVMCIFDLPRVFEMERSLLYIAVCVVVACVCVCCRYVGKSWGAHPGQMGVQYTVGGTVGGLATGPHPKQSKESRMEERSWWTW